jgi:hypothetical protein
MRVYVPGPNGEPVLLTLNAVFEERVNVPTTEQRKDGVFDAYVNEIVPKPELMLPSRSAVDELLLNVWPEASRSMFVFRRPDTSNVALLATMISGLAAIG